MKPTARDMAAAKLLYVQLRMDWGATAAMRGPEDLRSALGDGGGTAAWAEVEGLRHKYFVYSPDTGTYSGVYVFFSMAKLAAYMDSELFTAQASHEHVSEVSAVVLDVMEGSELCIENTAWGSSPAVCEEVSSAVMLVVHLKIDYDASPDFPDEAALRRAMKADGGGYPGAFAGLPGLRGKYFVYDGALETCSGFYTFVSRAALDAYMRSELFAQQADFPHVKEVTYSVHEVLPGTERTMDLRGWGSELPAPAAPAAPAVGAEAAVEVAVEVAGAEKGIAGDESETLAGQAPAAPAEMLREAAGMHADALGPGHPATLEVAQQVGQVLREQTRLGEAEPWYRQILAAKRAQLGDVHLETLDAMVDLAILLAEQQGGDGAGSEADTLHREALRGRREALGADNPATLASIAHVAEACRLREEFGEAEALLREALSAICDGKGSEHPEAMAAMTALAGVLRGARKLVEAEQLYKRALEGRRKGLGEFHPDTLASVNNLSSLQCLLGARSPPRKSPPNPSMQLQGNLVEAEMMLYLLLDGRQASLGETHPDTLNTTESIAALLGGQPGRRAEAEPLLRASLQHRRATLGDSHSATLSTARQLGQLLTNLAVGFQLN
eukprot:gene5768-6957_t